MLCGMNHTGQLSVTSCSVMHHTHLSLFSHGFPLIYKDKDVSAVLDEGF